MPAEAKAKAKERIMKIAETSEVEVEAVTIGKMLRQSESRTTSRRTRARSEKRNWQRFSALLAENSVTIQTNALKQTQRPQEKRQLQDSDLSHLRRKAKAKARAREARRPEGARMILKQF